MPQDINSEPPKFALIFSIIMVVIFGGVFIKTWLEQKALTDELMKENAPIETTTSVTLVQTTTTTLLAKNENPEPTTTIKINTALPTTKPITSTTIPTVSSSLVSNNKVDLTFKPTIASKYNHTCVLLASNNVKCWGNNEFGQLGNGEKSDHPVHSAVSVLNLNNVVDITVGGWGTCALLQDKTVECWGVRYPKGNYWYYIPLPNNEFKLQNIIAVSSGYTHTCVLFLDGTVQCWGYNQYGQLGNGTNDDTQEPVVVKDLYEVKQISAGYFHTCALIKDGTVKCWGDNTFGALGNGTTTSSNVPVLVSNLANVKAISAGNGYTCALLNNGQIKCWGRNNDGQLGDGTTNDKLIPTLVKNLENDEVIKVTTGGFITCALLKNQTIKCWGDWSTQNKGVTVNFTPVPLLVEDLNNVIDVAAGKQHICVLLENKTAKCWGLNQNAQIGDGTFDYYVPLPRAVIGL